MRVCRIVHILVLGTPVNLWRIDWWLLYIMRRGEKKLWPLVLRRSGLRANSSSVSLQPNRRVTVTFAVSGSFRGRGKCACPLF